MSLRSVVLKAALFLVTIIILIKIIIVTNCIYFIVPFFSESTQVSHKYTNIQSTGMKYKQCIAEILLRKLCKAMFE